MKSDSVRSKFLAKSKKKSALSKVVDFFSHSTYNACVVGGYVRDLIMGIESPDIDITVEGNALKAAQDLNRQIKGEIKVHPGFKTARIRSEGRRIDLATARTESYPNPAALPVVEPTVLHNDFKRRDFTMNAIAISLARGSLGEVYDPFDGINDIGKRAIRILHSKSFVDDPTRIFRALRYKNRLGFHLERNTEVLLKKAVAQGMIGCLTKERMINEIRLIFDEPDYLETINDLSRYGVIPLDPRDKKRLRQYGNLGYYFYLSAINGKNLPLTAREKKIINEMPRLPDVIKRLRSTDASTMIFNTLQDLPNEIIRAIPFIAPELKKKIEKYSALRSIKPLLTGADLMRAGFKPGPEFRKKLDMVFELQLNGAVKNRKQALKALNNE